MAFSFQPKIFACLALSFCISSCLVKASDTEEEKSSLQKLINAFRDISDGKKAPSLRQTSDFSEWQATFEKAKQEATEKYGYLKNLRERDTKSYFEKIEANQTSLAETARFLTTTKIKELAIPTEYKVNDIFVDSADIFIVLGKFHEKISEYLPEKHKLLSQSYVEFSKYEETEQLQQLRRLFVTINPFMGKFFSEPILYQDSDALKEISKHILTAQQLIDELSKIKLKKRKGSNPAQVSPRSVESPKSEKTKKPKLDKKPRSKSFSENASKDKVDPHQQVWKKLSEEAASRAPSNSAVPDGK